MQPLRLQLPAWLTPLAIDLSLGRPYSSSIAALPDTSLWLHMPVFSPHKPIRGPEFPFLLTTPIDPHWVTAT